MLEGFLVIFTSPSILAMIVIGVAVGIIFGAIPGADGNNGNYDLSAANLSDGHDQRHIGTDGALCRRSRYI